MISKRQMLAEMEDSNLGEKQRILANGRQRRAFKQVCTILPKRYILAVMVFCGFVQMYCMRTSVNLAIVAMVENRTTVINGTLQNIGPKFIWTETQVGLVLASFYYGYILTQFIGGALANRVGGKKVFGGGILMAAILTLLTPLCIRMGLGFFIAVGTLKGIVEGLAYPSIYATWSKWAPPLEKTKLTSIGSAGSYIGSVIAMPIGGSLAESSGGWPLIFYVFGTLAIIWFVFWTIIVSESPASHSTISIEELEYIQSSIDNTEKQSKSVPWRSIALSRPVWAIMTAHIAENWGFYTWQVQMPSYLKFALKYDLQQAGFLAALPFIITGLAVLASGIIADYLRERFNMETGRVRKLFVCGAFSVQVVFMLVAGNSHVVSVAISCLTVGLGFGGFARSGYAANFLDIAPQYSSILMGISNTFATIPGIISPIVTAVVVNDRNDVWAWQRVFYIAAGVYLAAVMVFGLLGSGVRQKWAENPEDRDNTY